MRGIRHLSVIAVGVALLAAGCGKEAAQIAESQSLNVVATDYKFDGMPETITGGEVELTFSNKGKADHEFFIAQIGDTPAKALSDAIAKFEEGAPFPPYLRMGAVPAEVEPGKSITTRFTLPAGEYTLSCTLTDAPGGGEKEVAGHATLGMFQRVTVEGGEEDPQLEAAGGEFVASDYTFEAPASLTAGKNEYVFRNASPEQFHHMVLNEFPAGVSEEAALKATDTMMKLEQGKPPPAGTPEPKEAGFTGIMGPGSAQSVDLTLAAGRTYVAMCFIHDIAGGPPHAIKHKMYSAFTVPG